MKKHCAISATFYFILLFLLAGCASSQGISGHVTWVTGNQMPGPDSKPNAGKPVSREVCIFEPTKLEDATAIDGVFFDSLKTKLIMKVKTDENGAFKVKLAPGSYSVFVKEPNGLFANSFDGKGCINCITVNKNQITEITIQVNYSAAY